MNRKYIVICSFFVAFFVLSLLCYGSFEYAKKQEQKVFRVVTCIKGTCSSDKHQAGAAGYKRDKISD